jgi:hypothetical protein
MSWHSHVGGSGHLPPAVGIGITGGLVGLAIAAWNGGIGKNDFECGWWKMTTRRDADELAAMLWNRCLDDHLIVCSFTKSKDVLRYTGLMKGRCVWKSKVLKEEGELSEAILRAKSARNGSFAIALIRPNSQGETFFEGGLLTEEQAFSSYERLIEFVDGNPVIYNKSS